MEAGKKGGVHPATLLLLEGCLYSDVARPGGGVFGDPLETIGIKRVSTFIRFQRKKRRARVFLYVCIDYLQDPMVASVLAGDLWRHGGEIRWAGGDIRVGGDLVTR